MSVLAWTAICAALAVGFGVGLMWIADRAMHRVQKKRDETR